MLIKFWILDITKLVNTLIERIHGLSVRKKNIPILFYSLFFNLFRLANFYGFFFADDDVEVGAEGALARLLLTDLATENETMWLLDSPPAFHSESSNK